MHSVPTVRLAKYHGLGNDFLVMVVADGSAASGCAVAPSADEHRALARAACDRHRGIGADGLMVCTRSSEPDADLVMRLCNADGSIAEMSGNGIRCFVHAAIDAGLVSPGTVRVRTDGGLRTLVAHRSDESGVVQVEVGMGEVVLDAVTIPESVRELLGDRRATTVTVGNPHIVIDTPPGAVDLPIFGPAIEAWYLSTDLRGINVEVVERSTEDDSLNMAVWERGVGITQACGTGAVATAAVAHRWGMTGTHTKVSQPGGDATVVLAGGEATLIGPSQFVCVADFAWPRSDGGEVINHG